MPGIFISYRREDTAGHAGRIFDRLKERFGRDKVFMDVAGIEPGVDFVEAIDQAVGSCDVLLVIIGKKWLTCTDASGKRRLDDPKDFIRLETATALRRDIRVIPVLVQDAAMPGDGDLPDELKKLARRQATEISDTHWDTDTGQLIDTLAKLLHEEPMPAPGGMAHVPVQPVNKPAIPSPGPSGMGKNKLTWIISAIMALAVVLGGLLYFVPSNKEPEVVMASVLVPRLEGQPLEKAHLLLEMAGLKAAKAVRKETREAPEGTVIEQAPRAGTKLARGGMVELVVAASPPDPVMVSVPDVTGREVKKAVVMLKDAGLIAKPRIEREETTKAKEGAVLKQSLKPGSRVRPDEVITLVLAVLPRDREAAGEIVLPDFTGSPARKVEDYLKEKGLVLGPVHERASSEHPAGTVIGQRPPAGTRMEKGGEVLLLVAASPPEPMMVRVPDVAGRAAREAVATLKEAGVNTEPRIEREETTKAEAGTVLKQSLKPGSRVRTDEVITLVIAVSPRNTEAAGEIVLPDFTGSPVRRVEDYLKEKGLVLGPVQEKASSEHQAGTVIAQRPPAKTRMEKGGMVLLQVAVSAGDAALLPAPVQAWPEEGRSFDNIPRTMAVRWKPVSGAASYTVELDCMHCCEPGRWCSDLGKPWKLARGLPAVNTPGHKFEFAGAQPGRWRVWAVEKNGREGEKSPWRTFRYTR